MAAFLDEVNGFGFLVVAADLLEDSGPHRHPDHRVLSGVPGFLHFLLLVAPVQSSLETGRLFVSFGVDHDLPGFSVEVDFPQFVGVLGLTLGGSRFACGNCLESEVSVKPELVIRVLFVSNFEAGPGFGEDVVHEFLFGGDF